MSANLPFALVSVDSVTLFSAFGQSSGLPFCTSYADIARLQFGYSSAEIECWFWAILSVKDGYFRVFPSISIHVAEEDAGSNLGTFINLIIAVLKLSIDK